VQPSIFDTPPGDSPASAIGGYYTLQFREGGKPVARYVPREEAELVASHTANYERFQTLVGQYVALVAAQTRAERQAGSKNRTPRPSSS
jgi:hypothetical protein